MSDECLATHYGPQKQPVKQKGKYYYILFDGAGANVNCGSDASLDNIPSANSLTVDAWIRADSYGGGAGAIICKTIAGLADGWSFMVSNTVGLRAYVYHAAGFSADSRCGLDDFTADGEWHHVAMAYDFATSTNYIAIDGEWVAAYDTQQAGTGVYSEIGATSVRIGVVSGTNANDFDGGIQWVRLSDALRWTPGVDFTPPDICEPPAEDADTVEIWAMDEGKGTDAAATVNSANDGTITDGAWRKCKPW